MRDNVRHLLNIVQRRYLLIMGGILLYCTLFQVLYNLLKYDVVAPYDSFREFVTSYLYNLIPIVVIILLNIGIIFFIPGEKLFSGGGRMSVKILKDMVLATAVFFVVGKLFLFVGGFINPQIKIDWVGAGLSVILIFLIVEVAYYLITSKAAMRKAQEVEMKAMQYRYEVLKAQVNPHFLFNSLNILYSLIAIDPEKSREFTLQLSAMYRYLLLWQNKDVVPLEEEIEFLKSYVEVLEMRHRGQLKVTISGEENATGRMIVPHTLQLLVENVTKHNVISARNPMHVTVLLGQAGITVSNPVRPKETTNSTGLGIKYIQELYAKRGRSVLITKENNVFVAEIPYL